jgi:hypothetical protein
VLLRTGPELVQFLRRPLFFCPPHFCAHVARTFERVGPYSLNETCSLQCPRHGTTNEYPMICLFAKVTHVRAQSPLDRSGIGAFTSIHLPAYLRLKYRFSMYYIHLLAYLRSKVHLNQISNGRCTSKYCSLCDYVIWEPELNQTSLMARTECDVDTHSRSALPTLSKRDSALLLLLLVDVHTALKLNTTN